MAAICEWYEQHGPVLVLQHRGELLFQNRQTLSRFNRGIKTEVINADRKCWAKSGVTFAMVQTLSRAGAIETIPDGMSLLCIDEAHHLAADSYMRIIHMFRERSPHGHILGVTATPERGDKKALSGVLGNVCDNVTMSELVVTGNLVPPRAFVIELNGIAEGIAALPKTAADFDMGAVEQLMDNEVVSDAIIQHWREKAGGRQTVAFASTIVHAEHLANAFAEAGIPSGVVHGERSAAHNAMALRAFDTRKTTVLVNCMKLTEGWDCQIVSCVLLARPCSQKSTMIQMVGRGLRTIDPARYPGVIKDDCVILDFGRSLLTHGDIDAGDRLEPFSQAAGDPPMKECPDCGMIIHAAMMTCPACGHVFEAAVKDISVLETFQMTELQLIELSPYKWEDIAGGLILMANRLKAWACVVDYGGTFCAIGGTDATREVTLTSRSRTKLVAMASADDFLRENGDRSNSLKTKSWLNLPPTEKQLQTLGGTANSFSMSRYRASCLITWKFVEGRVKAKVLSF